MPEALESRRVLAAYVVSTVADVVDSADGLISLREAVTAANTNVASGDAIAGDVGPGIVDRISFDPSLASQTIALASTLVISDAVEIDASATGVTLDAGGNFRIMDVLASTTILRLQGLNLINGTADGNGGAMQIASGVDTSITNVSFMNNNADDGGAIFNSAGTLTIANSEFIDNTALGSSGSGGAIFHADGALEISRSGFYGNIANRAGGAIEVDVGSMVATQSVFGSVANPNVAGPAGSASPGNGGALHVTGNADIQILSSRIVGNIAAREGGGLWNSTGSMQIVNTVIANNRATGAAADDGGGGIFNNGGTLSVNRSEILSNRANGAAGSGGGIFNNVGGRISVSTTSIANNIANRAGGGIEDLSGIADGVRIIGGSLSSNIAGPTGTASPGNGGGLHVTGSGGSLIVGTFVSNNVAADEGGGLWNGTGLMVLRDVSVFANSANGKDPDQGGGGIFNEGGTVNIRASSVFENTALGISGSGGGIFNNSGGSLQIVNSEINFNIANRAGGGIEDNSGENGRVRLVDTILSNNLAGVANTDNPAPVTVTANPGNGGALHVSGAGDVQIIRGTLDANEAASEGGALWNGTGRMTIRDVVIQNNAAHGASADNGGGGIFNSGGYVRIFDSLIQANVADGISGSGGGIFNDLGGSLYVNSTTLSLNSAKRAGGGIEDNSGAGTTVELQAVSLIGNTAGGNTGANPGNGGGLHVTGAGDVTIKNSFVTNNTASAEGGGLWNGSGLMQIVRTSIEGNTANGDASDQGGGGIYNEGGSLELIIATVSNNDADGINGSGGGILNGPGGNALIRDSFINDNTAIRAGGGIEDVMGGEIIIIRTEMNGNQAIGGGDTAPGNGGALHVTGNATVRITGGTFNRNIAASEGGGLWNGSGKMDVRSSSFTSNSANGSDFNNGGGAIFNNGGQLIVLEVTSNGNVVNGGKGADVMSDGGRVVIRGSSLGSGSAAATDVALIDANGLLFDNIFSGNSANVAFFGSQNANNTFNVGPNEMTTLQRTLQFDNSLTLLEVSGGDLDDVFNVTPSANTSFNVRGGENTASGDTLTVNKQNMGGTQSPGAPGSGVFQVSGTMPVNYDDIELANSIN